MQERVGRTRHARHVVAQQFADGGQKSDVGLSRASRGRGGSFGDEQTSRRHEYPRTKQYARRGDKSSTGRGRGQREHAGAYGRARNESCGRRVGHVGRWRLGGVDDWRC